ncbi:CDP-glycerol:poly(glycerophosphate) glycerophosphotransferase [Pediococcus damnosus]|uniref:CDP-glycerol:poly(Glycerophosphate) glycerophosphotransferase n=1 Tax=Pediococcus damnosus TaxID=51663 RepID=A0A143B1M9_9LACO|nr:CDP-glycerol glycerophosphotransferase family protein [Pediococcus damnosus]AMV62047.1 CDP-glycerol:poly(glycerophosphate) glycerophosphotransferase [Pediococcus damnosus]AMV68103.1 CDP-glycerol:poly(glycerophosphate) glycerophosphotransferase [Pediococcus damnosus]AMV70288.1 CDP-glycerol:poly(glycerophosphate) glycerophosphotransferase [Pediococcus damnosus]KJU75025.1 CDP-glycerol glycerophosphotransferase [Pediococcus damnosus LMG 28219]PIO81946.1 CDP-glycerol--poly(glycerophosphate) glyc
MRHGLIQTIKILIRYILVVINDCLIHLPIKRHLTIFESFNGQAINDNPAAIYRELKILHPEAADNLFFGIKGSNFAQVKKANPDVQLLKRWSLKWIWVTARANYWIFNSRMPLWWHKNAQTIYVQTWHGTPLKKLGLDIENVEIPGTSTKKYHDEFKKESARWDYLIAPNAYSENIFKRAFGFKNKFIRSGYPRNDLLITTNQTEINKLKIKLLGDNVDQVILYAPTWRDDNFIYKGRYRFDLPFDLKDFFASVPAHTVLIIRPHYLVKDHIDIRGFEDRVKIMADTDINQLYLISDLLITDYSSVMFDYANLHRPILFFPYDLKHYAGDLRGFYFDYLSQCPGPIVTQKDQFYEQLTIFSANKGFPNYQEQINKFDANFLTWENGTAAKQVIESIGF